MSRNWLLRPDTHWVLREILPIEPGGAEIYAPRPQELCLLKILGGECRVEVASEKVHLAGTRMLLLDTELPCRLLSRSPELRLEAMVFALNDGHVIGDTSLQLAERFAEYRRFCHDAPGPLLFDDSYLLTLPMLRNMQAFTAFGDPEESRQLLHLYISYILLVIVCAAAEEERRFSASGNRHVRRALRYIHQHFTGDISARDISGYVGVHSGHLHRLFTAEAGMSMGDYIQKLRLKRAEFLLMHTELPLADISRMTGLSSQQYLSRIFREAYDVTPSLFRQSYNITCKYSTMFNLACEEEML